MRAANPPVFKTCIQIEFSLLKKLKGYVSMKYEIMGTIILVLDIIAIFGILKSGYSMVGKLLWGLIVLALPLLGMILWFLIGERRVVV
jgi:hypothetical protein